MKTYYRVLEVLLSEIQDNLDKKIGLMLSDFYEYGQSKIEYIAKCLSYLKCEFPYLSKEYEDYIVNYHCTILG